MIQCFDKILKGTEKEDGLVILQFLKGAIGQRFSFLNYYKEIPVSYDATLISVENEMAEFELHEYQAKAISLERRTLIHSHPKSPFREDIIAEVFYINIAKKRTILRKFGYAKINSQMRRFVRVVLDNKSTIHMFFENEIKLSGTIKDISLGGAAVNMTADDLLTTGLDLDVQLTLPDVTNNKNTEILLRSKIIKIIEPASGQLLTCMLEFYPEKHSQQQISYFINQRQVSIIKELKELIL